MTATANGVATERGVGQLPLERLTVALIPMVVAHLQRLQETTGLSKTDLVNRGISLYQFIDEQLRAGQILLLQDKQTGKTQFVHLMGL